MPALTVNDELYQGDTLNITVPVINSTGQTVSVNGASLTYVIQPTIGATASVTKSTSAGTITLGQGQATMTLNTSDTSSLTPSTYYHQMTMVDSTGRQQVIFKGDLTIMQKG